MGFLDNLGNLSPEQTQGLLAAAQGFLNAGAPSLRPVGFGQALAGGIGGFQGGYDHAMQRKLQQEQAAQAAQLHGLQIQGLTGELQDKDISRKQNLDAQQFLRNYNAGAASPTRLAQSVLGTDLSPTMENSARMAEARSMPSAASGSDGSTEQLFNSRIAQAAAMRATGNPLLVSQADALEKQALSFRPEFDQTPRFANGPDGKPFAYVLDKSGNQKRLDGVLPRDEMKLADLGGRQMAYNPFQITPGQSFGKTMTPGEIASNGIARQRLGFDMQQAGKPVFNADAGGFILPPSEANPNGKLISVDGIQGKPPTEFQGKSAAYGLRATEADKILGGLQGRYDPTAINSKLSVSDWPLIGGALGAATNKLALSTSDQLAEQAQRNFVNAVLRQESGAAIGSGEFDNARRQYFPQPGDSDEVIQQKAQNRQLAIQGLQANAGRSALTAPSTPARKSVIRGQVVDGYRFKGGDPADQNSWEKQ